jgi:hypothetical protein
MRIERLVISALLVCGLPAVACAQSVIGEVFASDASVHGSVLFASGGTQIQSGSSVSAGDAAALLKLKRGGEVRICPQTTVSVSASPSGRDLLWGMNTGSVEAHYTLFASADTLMTPDFRILLAGPGTFDFAISANAHGDACVKALPSNTASLIVSELGGDGTYQVKPNEQIVFRGGHVASTDGLLPPECGCPPPPVPVQRAEAKPEPKREPNPEVASNTQPNSPLLPGVPDSPESLNLPARPIPNDIAHLEMEAPFVYSPADPEEEMEMAVVRLRLTSGSNFANPVVLPPPEPKPAPASAQSQKSAKKQDKKGFFGKLGGFFSSIFK